MNADFIKKHLEDKEIINVYLSDFISRYHLPKISFDYITEVKIENGQIEVVTETWHRGEYDYNGCHIPLEFINNGEAYRQYRQELLDREAKEYEAKKRLEVEKFEKQKYENYLKLKKEYEGE